MYGNKLLKIGRKSVPECRSRKVYCGLPGVCSYLLDVICILVYDCVYYQQFVRTLMAYFVAVEVCNFMHIYMP